MSLRAPMGWTPALLALLFCTTLVPILAANFRNPESLPSAGPAGSAPFNRPQIVEVRAAASPADVGRERLADEKLNDQEPTASQLRRQLDEARKALAELQRRLEEIAGTSEASIRIRDTPPWRTPSCEGGGVPTGLGSTPPA